MKKLCLLLACLLFVLPACAQEYIALKGDLHCHSSFSPDSDVPVEEVIAAYTQAGYDFIALTEHNQIKHLRKDWSTDELMVLPGYELTLSAGHYNVFGIREFQRKFDMNKAELAEYFVYLKGLGALIQLDHPNAHPYASRYGYDLDIDMVEVINGNITADDLQTLEEYQQLLAEGRKLIAMGNTDAHHDHASKQLHNYVLVTERTQDAVMQALRQGHTSIRVTMDAPIIELTCGESIMGDTVAYEDNQQISLSITGLKKGSEVRVYTQAGAEKYQPEGETFELSIATDEANFVRAEVWRHGLPQTISNPIYISR